MSKSKDSTLAIREAAAAFPEVAKGTSCNQSSFKAGKNSFLFIGPGAKGVGRKAMFKLEASRSQAERLASEQSDRFEVGSGPWVTTRFSDEQPLPKSIWQKWLKESYSIATGGNNKSGSSAKVRKKK